MKYNKAIKLLKMNMRDCPDVYFFSEDEAIDPQVIEGDALIFIGTPDKNEITAIRAVKNKTYYTLKDISSNLMNEIKSNWHNLSDAQKSFTPTNKLIRTPLANLVVNQIAQDLNFPYIQCTIHVYKDSIIIDLPEEGEIHPRLKYNAGEKVGFEALDFLQKYGKQLVEEFALKEGGFTLGDDDGYRLESALRKILLAIEPVFAKLRADISSIQCRFSTHPDTHSKRNILSNFEEYCCFNWKEGISKKALVEGWLESYIKTTKNDENPFTVLMRQRRTGLLSIFNPKLTDSIKLFLELLGKEELPELLKQAIGSNSAQLKPQ